MPHSTLAPARQGSHLTIGVRWQLQVSILIFLRQIMEFIMSVMSCHDYTACLFSQKKKERKSKKKQYLCNGHANHPTASHQSNVIHPILIINAYNAVLSFFCAPPVFFSFRHIPLRYAKNDPSPHHTNFAKIKDTVAYCTTTIKLITFCG